MSFGQQIKSVDKYPSIFSFQMEVIMFIHPSSIFLQCDIFSLVMHLDQSRMSENNRWIVTKHRN